MAAVAVWAVCAAGCGVEWFDADAGPVACTRAPSGECDDSGDAGDDAAADDDACALGSARAVACEPAALSDLSISVVGLPWSEPGAHIGIAECEVSAVEAMPGMSTLQLACVHTQGDPIEPLVTLAIVSSAVDVAALRPGRQVRLTAAATLSDDDAPSTLFIKLARPDDDALLLAASEGWGRVAPPEALLAEVGLVPADWYAPLSIALVGDVCTSSPAPCSGTRERAAVSFTAAGRDPATVLAGHHGPVDGGWQATVGAAELFSDPRACKGNQPRSDLVVVATAGCPR